MTEPDADWWKPEEARVEVEHICSHCGFSLTMTSPDVQLFAVFTQHECQPK